MYAVILAGGGGTRLWPLSDPEHPKPFLPIFPDGSLLQKTIRRLTEGRELDLGIADVTVVTDQRYEKLVRQQTDVAVLSEPMGRNTAAAIALATLAIDRPPSDVMVVLPADHLVEKEGLFRSVLANACRELAQGAFDIASPLVTLGAQAEYPATQYGYLVPDVGQEQVRDLHSYVLDAFVEKPDQTAAASLRARPGVAWNAGIFMARRSAMADALLRHTALIEQIGAALGDRAALSRTYRDIAPVSIDYAVMEPEAAAGGVVMAGMDVGWSDVGTWTALVHALVGGYDSAARVVPPGESIRLSPADICILREESDGNLDYEPGPLAAISSTHPMAFLPDAREHEPVLLELLIRVNEWVALSPAQSAAEQRQ